MLVLVSPEVGLTVVPATAAGRRFADELGTDQRMAALCDRVVLVVAGQPFPVKPFGNLWNSRPAAARCGRLRSRPRPPGHLTKPRGALGRLEDLSVWVSSCQGQCPPRQFERARVVVFAGDHGVAGSGVSAYRRK